jgi:hypothetical protein
VVRQRAGVRFNRLIVRTLLSARLPELVIRHRGLGAQGQGIAQAGHGGICLPQRQLADAPVHVDVPQGGVAGEGSVKVFNRLLVRVQPLPHHAAQGQHVGAHARRLGRVPRRLPEGCSVLCGGGASREGHG